MNKRYGMIYVNRKNNDLKDMKRMKKNLLIGTNMSLKQMEKNYKSHVITDMVTALNSILLRADIIS